MNGSNLIGQAIHRPWVCRAMLVASGALTGLCLAFPKLGVLEWLTIVPYLLVCFTLASDEAVKLRRLYTAGLWFNMGFSLVIFHWFVYMYPLEFAGLSPAAALVVVIVAWWGLSLLQSLFGALLPPMLALLLRGRIARRVPTLAIPAVAALWCIREWCQTLIWTGVPWGRLAIGQTEMTVMLGTARYLGSYAITFALVAFNACVAYALLHADKKRTCMLTALGLLAAQLVVGGVVLLTDGLHATDRTVTFAAVQGNISSTDKWKMSANESFYEYLDLSVEAAEQGADVIVWPETAVPKLGESPRTTYPARLSSLAKEHDAVILAGYYISDDEGNHYNSIRAYDTDGRHVDPYYAKRHPVPFGEYVPMRSVVEVLVPPLTEISQLSGDVAAGECSAVFDTAHGRIGALICFDSIYEMLAVDSVRDGAEVLSVSTNDSWFFDSAAVYMHNAQAKLRAVETGRYVVRTATTGVSSIITPTGKVVDELPPLEQGVLYGEVELRSDMTMYVCTGNLLVWLCIAGGVALLADHILCRVNSHKEKR